MVMYIIRKQSISIYFIILFDLTVNGYGERTKEKMYEDISGASGCYRRLNSTHQTGCSSIRGGSTGVIHYCDTQKDLDFILSNGTAGPYIPVLPTNLFNVRNVEMLKMSDKISGLVLFNNTEKLDHFTHEKQCPNERFSIEGSCETKNSATHLWNPDGTGLLYSDVPFPVFHIEDDVSKVRECFQKFNNFSYETQKDRSLCSLELNAFMYATTNTPTCKRRSNIGINLNPVKFCDPLGDYNIWASLFPLVEGPHNQTKPRKDYEYIVIASRLDTTSFFDLTTGAVNPITSIVTLLSVAKLLKMMFPEDINSNNKNVLFIMFNGETYDYIGSQRLLYDMEQKSFPVDLPDDNDILPLIHPENITLFIELSQLSNTKGVYAHFMYENDAVTNFYQKLTNNSAALDFHLVRNSLPPASLHTFLQQYQTLPGLVLADHEHSYINKYYNSIYDNASNIDYVYYNASEEDSLLIPKNSIQWHVVNISYMIARSVYEEIMNKSYTGDATLDVALVDELFYCYLEEPNCRVSKAVQKSKLPKTLVTLYVGVDVSNNIMTHLTSLILSWFTGDIVEGDSSYCTNTPKNYAFHYYNMSKSIYELNVTLCFKASSNVTEAVSPAFIIEDYDWSSEKYSSWAESTWAAMSMRMFLKPSQSHESMTLIIGSMSMIFSLLIVYFITSRSHILFAPPLSSEGPADC